MTISKPTDKIVRLDYAPIGRHRRDIGPSDAQIIGRLMGLIIGTIMFVTLAAAIWVACLLCISAPAASISGH